MCRFFFRSATPAGPPHKCRTRVPKVSGLARTSTPRAPYSPTRSSRRATTPGKRKSPSRCPAPLRSLPERGFPFVPFEVPLHPPPWLPDRIPPSVPPPLGRAPGRPLTLSLQRERLQVLKSSPVPAPEDLKKNQLKGDDKRMLSQRASHGDRQDAARLSPTRKADWGLQQCAHAQCCSGRRELSSGGREKQVEVEKPECRRKRKSAVRRAERCLKQARAEAVGMEDVMGHTHPGPNLAWVARRSYGRGDTTWVLYSKVTES